MDLSLIVGVAEIVGGLAIVGSLIYVGLQVNQNTRAVRASAHQGLLGHLRENTILLINQPELMALVRKGEADPSSLTDQERDRFNEYAGLRFASYEAAYYTNQKGLLDAEVFDAWDAYYRTLAKTPGYVAHYRAASFWYVASFQRYFESLMED